MLWNFLFGFAGTFLASVAIGYPIASLLGLAQGWRGIGYGGAFGLSAWLIVCRGLQMHWPIDQVATPLGIAWIVVSLALWAQPAPRRAAATLMATQRWMVPALAATLLISGALMCAPIIFGNAIQFEGTRNADSFTFTSNAQYMLHHAFYGAPDFSPERPVYAISRGYFGSDAMQPRPAAEGFLAWLSAVRGIDPMYLYNATQAAGVLIAGLCALCFLGNDWRPRSFAHWLVATAIAAATPALIHTAANSNFANALNLPAATVFVAIGRERRSARTVIAGVICAGCLLSGYPEMLPFVVAARLGIAVCNVVVSKSLRQCVIDALSVIGELCVAALLVPWAAMGTYIDFKTTLAVSHQGSVEMGGKMFATAPSVFLAVVTLCVAWRHLQRDMRAMAVAVLMTFGFFQWVMVQRGFAYGGEKLNEYFSTLLAGITLVSVIAIQAASKSERVMRAVIIYGVVIAAVVPTWNQLQSAWNWSEGRRVTPEMVAAGKALASFSGGKAVALGHSPQPFYYGMWMAYISSTPIAYDLTRDSYAAGYLSPYLNTQAARAAELFNEAPLRLDIEDPSDHHPASSAIVRFGQVSLSKKD